jgi:hypothetical protein
MYQQDQLSISFLLNLCTIALFVTIEFNFIFDEIDDLYKATFHIT